jgi:hypothetical protein
MASGLAADCGAAVVADAAGTDTGGPRKPAICSGVSA